MSSSTFSIYAFIPVERARISEMPIIPMLPAKLVRIVLVFFVRRFLRLKERAVKKDIEVCFFLPLKVFGSTVSKKRT